MQENNVWEILLIDDDEDDYLITREMLADTKGARVQLTWASTYDQARARIFSADQYDAILIDYDLGQHTGLEIIREASSQGYPAPMILLTGRGSYEVDVEAMQAGASVYLTKNEINPLLLERSIRYALDRKRSERALIEANEALRVSEERFRVQKRELEVKNQQLEGLFEQAPVGLALFLAQEPYMLLAHNQFYEKMWKPSHGVGSLVGQYIPDYLPNAEESGLLDLFGEVKKTGKGRTIIHFPYDGLKSGRVWWNLTVSPVFTEGRLMALAHLLVDTTEEVTAQMRLQADLEERERTEEALKKALARLQRLINSDVIGVIISNPEGDVIEANDYFLNLIGASRADLDAGLVRWDKITPPEHRPADERALEQIRNTGKCEPFEKEYLRADGSRAWVLLSIARLPEETGYHVVFVLNISDRKFTERAYLQSQEALVQSEARFQVLADSMSQLVWMADPDGTVTYYNKRAAEYDGIHQREEAWVWAPVLHEEDIQSTIDAWSKAVETGQMYEAEHRVRMADGSFRWHLSRGVPMRDHEGNVLKWYGTATDIHEQKMIEEALRQREIQLRSLVQSVESSNRDLEQFAFVASHDLQEPLRKVRAFSDRLRHSLQGRLTEQEQDYIQRMENAAERMQGMINDLLQLSRVSTSKRDTGPVDFNSLIKNVLQELQGQINNTGAQITREALPTVTGDRLLLHQMMQHLLDNALKFRRQDIPPVISIRSVQEGGYARLIVEDNGIGFDPVYAERIFQPFVRLHGFGVYSGSGMGLAISRKIAERHQGEIHAIGRPGEGSTFIVSLPLHRHG